MDDGFMLLNDFHHFRGEPWRLGIWGFGGMGMEKRVNKFKVKYDSTSFPAVSHKDEL